MSDQEIRFRIVVEDAGVAPAVGRTDAGFQRVGAAAAGASRQTTAAMRMLPAQLSDVATQLAGGQNPFTVLLQQGLQTRDMFGGFREAGRGLLSVLTPMRVAIGGAAAAVGALAFAAYSGREEAMALVRAIELNGQAAGRTIGQIDGMARSLQAATGTSIGNAREALDGLAASGAFVGENMLVAGRAIVSVQKLSGQSTAEMVRHFAGIRDGVTAWSVAANRAYNFLNAAQVEQIRTLESQGRGQEAIRVSLEALASTMEQRTVPAMGLLERAIQGVKNAGSGFWDWLKDVGRPETVEEQLEKVRKQLAYQRTTPDVRGVRDLRQREAELQEMQRMQQRAAEARAQTAADNAKQIEEQAAAHQGALIGLEQATQAKLLAEQLRSQQAQRLAVDLQFQQRTITAEQYTNRIIALERQRVAAELAAAQQTVEAERRRVVEKPADVVARERAVLQAQTAVVAKLAERDKLEARIRAGELRVGDYAVGGESLGTLFRQSELAATASVEQGMVERRRAATESAAELVRINQGLAAELIKDDRTRAFAQLDIEAQQLRRRLDIASASAEQRQQIEDSLATWRVQREQQLNEQLKPQWQRMLEDWTDTTRDMRRRYDDFMQGFLTSGRDAFTQWAADGRMSASSLAAFIRAQFAQLLYERYLSGYVKSAGEWLFSTLLGSPAPYSGMPDGVPTRGGRAGGGGVMAGSAYLVGERGPEVLVMGQQPGFVIPNHALAGAGAGSTLNQYFTLRGNEDASTLYALANMASDQAVARVADLRRRGAPGY